MSGTKLRVAVIGGGRVGLGFCQAMDKDKTVELTGVVTRSQARQAELAERFGIRAYDTTEALLASPDRPDVAAVVNANDAHKEATIACLEAGCHVYCEKPMAPTIGECEEMVAAEARSGKVLQVGFEYMHGTMTRRIKHLVDEGFFGTPTWISCLDSRGHWWSIDPDADIEELWKLDRKRGGGIIFHCGIHQLDMIRTLLGPIAEVTAYRPPVNALSFYPADVPDNVTLMLKAEGGAVANFQVFHNRAPAFYRQPNFHPDWRTVPGHEFGLSLIGTKGSCKMDIYAETLSLFRFDLEAKETVYERTEVFSPNHPDQSHHDMKGFLKEFLVRMARGEGPVVPAKDHLESMRLAAAAEDAIAKGTTVRVADYHG